MRLYLRLISDPHQYRDAAEYATNPPFVAPDGFEWVEGTPPEGATVHVEPSLYDKVKAAFGALTLEQQTKYEDEILKAAFFLREENYQMVAVNILRAEAKLALPEDAAVKAIIDTAKTELEAMP